MCLSTPEVDVIKEEAQHIMLSKNYETQSVQLFQWCGKSVIQGTLMPYYMQA